MASQSATGSRDLNMNSKVAVPSGKPTIGTNIRQPKVGKETMNGGQSMPGSKGLGQAVKTVPSNPISGSKSAQPGNTAMGNGGVIGGFV
jgi:hypothetical protein